MAGGSGIEKRISFSLWGDRHTDRTMKIFVNKVDVRKIKINDTIKVAQSEQ